MKISIEDCFLVKIDHDATESHKIAEFVRWQMLNDIWPYLGHPNTPGTYLRWFKNKDKAVIADFFSSWDTNII